jgi:hypothetical protein
MKHIFTVIILLFTISTKAQIGIGTSTPDASAKLDITSATQGFLPPRMTTAQRDAISSPATGLQIYNTDKKAIETFTGTTGVWFTVGMGNGTVNPSDVTNTVVGVDVLKSITSPMYGTAGLNTAVGYNALYSNTTGYSNTAVGYAALFLNAIGNQNTAIGRFAGFNSITGYNNTLIGYNAQVSSQTINNQITLGDNRIASLRCNVVSITALSDKRDKTDIIPIVEGLAFLKQLNPVSFTWNTRDKARVGIKSAGFIAQELLALQKQSNIGDNLDLVSEDNPEKLEARYGNLLPVIVKAIQEESAEKDLKISNQDKEIKALNERLDALEKQITQMLKK